MQALAGPDPAGVLPMPTSEQVSLVAAYMTRLAGRFVLQSPYWALIERGEPVARAIFWHELQELEAYRRLGARDPLTLPPDSAEYWQAHAWASWKEAEYWAAWAQAEGEDIAPAAFLLAHPRARDELERDAILNELSRSWGVAIGPPTSLQLQQAQTFYRRKGLPGARDGERGDDAISSGSPPRR